MFAEPHEACVNEPDAIKADPWVSAMQAKWGSDEVRGGFGKAMASAVSSRHDPP